MFKASPDTDLRMTEQGKRTALKNINRLRAEWAAEKATKEAERHHLRRLNLLRRKDIFAQTRPNKKAA